MAQPSTSHPLISCADRKIRYGPITHHNYSDRLLAFGRGPRRSRSRGGRNGRDGFTEAEQEMFEHELCIQVTVAVPLERVDLLQQVQESTAVCHFGDGLQ